MQNDIEIILNEIASKDSQVLCREVLSIGDTMDVLRSKWTVEILTDHGKQLYVIVYRMTEWGMEHRRLMLGK